ncbi:glycosyl transferase gt-a type structural fold [Fusarium longipes]|uniref:Glycosyl transferase gt-a type structural fold n=1 Tax=Fusarium longipes TaxID=694270 RepID=A0A395RZP5_9HYPO|nr:glycosyl transferase gt-a type structural fold [Fusarium longipes]
MSSKQLRIGVFIPSSVQLLDLATVDVLASMSSEYLGILPLPAHISKMAPSTRITYITSPKLFPDVALTADLTVRATRTYEDSDVAPGNLDIIIVPGTEPGDSIEQGAKKWLRDQFNTEGVDVLCVCTAVFLCGDAGILDGKSVSGPRGFQNDLRKKYPNVKFVGEKYRWIQDGNLWTSGGITNGNDMMVAYAYASSKYWPKSIVSMGAMLTDVGDRPQMFDQGQGKFFLTMVWHIVYSWFSSLMPLNRTLNKTD